MLPQPGPSKGWYWFGGAMMVVSAVGAVALVAWAVVGLVGTIDRYERVAVPGRAVIEIDEPGTYTVFAEYQRAGRHFMYAPTVEVWDLQRERSVPVSWSGSVRTTYDWGGRHGESIGTVRFAAPGPYEVVTFGEGSPATAVAIGPEPEWADFALKLVGGILVGLIGFGIAVVVLVVVAVKRNRARRATAQPW